MRFARWSATSAAIVLLSLNLNAQSYPNGLNEDSVDPQADKEYYIQTNKRMDEIRKKYGRPTVGLVLSGGGAKGAAEVGAMKYLEEIGIPIDLVTGTSIGGLVGGLYTLGYTPADMQELFTTQDWSKILSDNVDTKYYSYQDKLYESRNLYSIQLGKNQDISTITTLPAGYAYGFNVNNLFSSLAVGYSGNISFMDLPIPYSAVTGEMVSTKAYNWVGGKITDAMRSTMSIPGLFNPVKTNNLVLVDGGVRNNFPADIAKAMGADIIIGIELSDARPNYEGINHIGNILSQFITMLGNEALQNNKDIPDVIIKPNLEGYGMLSFDPDAVNVMIERGYQAAKSKEKELLAIKEILGGNSKVYRNGSKAIDISKYPVRVKSIQFDGLSDAESAFMFDFIKFDITKKVDKQKMDDIMGRLQASGFFSEVKYNLEGSEAPYDLVFYCKLAPVNKFGFGLRGDTTEGVSLLLNYGLGVNKLLGSRLELETKLSHNLKARAKYTYVFPKLPAINLEASFQNVNMQFRYLGIPNHITAQYQSHNESIYISDVRWKNFNIQLGIQNYAFNQISEEALTTSFEFRPANANYVGAFFNSHLFTLDDFYFPTKGSDIRLEARYDFYRWGNNYDYIHPYKPYLYFAFSYKSVIPLASQFAIIPSINAVMNFDNNNNTINDVDGQNAVTSLDTQVYFGGTMSKRFHRNHIPFFGISKAYIVDNFLLTGAVEFRYNPVEKLYCSLLGGCVYNNYSYTNILNKNNLLYALGTEFTYKSIFGPIKLNVHWNDWLKWGAVVSIGYDF